jgi:hypothetical protein
MFIKLYFLKMSSQTVILLKVQQEFILKVNSIKQRKAYLDERNFSNGFDSILHFTDKSV